MGQWLSGQVVLCSRLIHNGRKITNETGKSNSTKQKVKHVNPTAQNKLKHVNQHHKTRNETRESNSIKHEVKHVNPTAQNKVKHINQAAQNIK
jgi:hypothetical protein